MSLDEATIRRDIALTRAIEYHAGHEIVTDPAMILATAEEFYTFLCGPVSVPLAHE